MIAGATGYAGHELVRILARHPHIDVVALAAHSEAGQSSRGYFPGVRVPDAFISAADLTDVAADVAFLALPNADAVGAAGQLARRGVRVIDLGAGFRFPDPAGFARWYGPHPAPDLLQESRTGYADDPRFDMGDALILGNPGCYPTAFFSAVAPLAARRLLAGPLLVNGVSGVSGAGRGLRSDLMFAEMAENFTAYALPGKHRHTGEMEAVAGIPVVFQPHLAPMDRGLLLTIYCPAMAGVGVDTVYQAWQDFYGENPFVTISTERPPGTRTVRGTNRVALHAAHSGSVLVLYAALDNLVKGAAGQAVQHLNRWMGWPWDAGLTLL